MTRTKAWAGRIALAAVKRTLPARMAADPVAALPDGLHAAVVGSGSPLPDPRRGNPCLAVIAGQRVFVVDAGEGASETLNRMQIGPAAHRGRAADPFPLRPHRRAGQPRHPALGGRSGARARCGSSARPESSGSSRATTRPTRWTPPIAPRTTARRSSRPPGPGWRPSRSRSRRATTPMVVLEDDDLTITAFTVDHAPAEPAVGYRFDYRGRSLVVSGDTAHSAGAGAGGPRRASAHPRRAVARAAQARRGRRARGRADRAGQDLLRPPRLSRQPAAGGRRGARGRGPRAGPHPHRPAAADEGLEGPFLGDAAERFSGPLWIARDGDLYSLPRRHRPRWSGPAMIRRGPGG